MAEKIGRMSVEIGGGGKTVFPVRRGEGVVEDSEDYLGDGNGEDSGEDKRVRGGGGSGG